MHTTPYYGKKSGHMRPSRRPRRSWLRIAAAASTLALYFFAVPASLTQAATPDPIKPNLIIKIPTVTFSEIKTTDVDGKTIIEVPFLADYISGVYKYAVGIASVIAAVMMMIGGFQYLTAGGDTSRVSAGKEKIQNALIGLALSLGAYSILYAVNPDLLTLQGLKLESVRKAAFTTDGEEGMATGGTASNCDEAVKKAKAEGKCGLPNNQKMKSPLASGGSYSCNYHFRDANYDYKKLNNLDYPSGWDTEIKAPFSGKVTYIKGGTGLCGNQIKLETSGGHISICHTKDWVDAAGTLIPSGKNVQQGEVIGHLGGNCCQGETPPADWVMAKKGWCKVAGTHCTDPTKKENCGCQPWQQSGNTSGPHVHITYSFPGTDVLACLE